MKTKPMTLEEFLRAPTLKEWNAELADGWSGSDGSSSSTDNIEGIRIGITSRSYSYSHLPANLHDWLYRLGRKHGLGSKFRKAADRAYRDICLERISSLLGWSGWKARRRCAIRYAVLRLFGAAAWTR